MTARLIWEPSAGGFSGASARAEGGSYHVWRNAAGEWKLTIGHGPEQAEVYSNEFAARIAADSDWLQRQEQQP